jgi:hypothetical protein
MKQSLMKDMGLKLVSLGLAVMLWWIIKLGNDLRYSYSRSNEPVISQVSDNKGVDAINAGPLSDDETKADGNYTRTSETLTLTGMRMGSVRVIQIMNGDEIAQTISPATEFIVSDSRIDIPPGTISAAAEGVNREIRVWSTVGYSEKGPEKFTIETGPEGSQTEK